MVQDPVRSILSRMVTRSFAPKSYFELNIDQSSIGPSRMKRSTADSPVEQSITWTLNDEGFEFYRNDSSFRSKRSSTIDFSQNTYSTVSADARIAAIGQSLDTSLNSFTEEKKKANDAQRYGGLLFEGGTTRWPFRYTPKSNVKTTTESASAIPLEEFHTPEPLYQSSSDLYDVHYYNQQEKLTELHSFQPPLPLTTETPGIPKYLEKYNTILTEQISKKNNKR